jgi:hypothetical protein
MDCTALPAVLVDTGAELSWFPAHVLESLGVQRRNLWRFRQVDGTVLERWVGLVYVHLAGANAADDVVFAEPGDLELLGAHTRVGDAAIERCLKASPSGDQAAPSSPCTRAKYAARSITSARAAPAGIVAVD